jgi:hypothetical protein
MPEVSLYRLARAAFEEDNGDRGSGRQEREYGVVGSRADRREGRQAE